jgi:predicted XRE-type DNA-binding protein
MNKRMIDGVEVEMSSGNVFADVDLPDADKLKIKSGLVIEITKAVRNLGLSQEEVWGCLNPNYPACFVVIFPMYLSAN